MSLTWSLIAVPFLIAMNAFFVAAEYALVATRSFQIEGLRRGKCRTAAALARMKADPASAIGAIQVCITMTNLLLGWIGEPAMSAVLEMPFAAVRHWSPAFFTALSTFLSFIVVTLLTVVFSELLPKALTLQFVEPAATMTAAPMAAVQSAVTPLVWVMNTVANAVTRALGLGRVTDMEEQSATADEIRLMTSQAAADGVLTPRERHLILSTLTLGRRSAKHVMVPRPRVTYLDLRKSMDDNRAVIGGRLYSRLPLCDGGMDRVVGLVHTKEFLVAHQAAGDVSVLSLIARPAVFAPEALPLDKLLAFFRERNTQFVFLVDEYGGVEGIVTLQDVVDELLGEELGDDPSGAVDSPILPPTARRGGKVFAGDTPLPELARRLDRAEWAASATVATVGGLVTARLGRLPLPDEEVDVDGVRLRVVASDGRVVQWVEIVPVESDAVAAGNGEGRETV